MIKISQNLVFYKINTNFAAMRKQKPIKHIEIGPYEFDFYFKSDSSKKTYLEIKFGEVATLRIDGRTHAYGYLLAAAEQEKHEQLHGYAVIVYQLATTLTKDQTLVDDAVSAINAYTQRKEAEGAEKAAEVTDSQELADQVLMEEVAAEAEMSENERKESRETFKESIKNVIEEKENGI